MTNCQHHKLLATTQLGTDGLRIYVCDECLQLFKVKPEEIGVSYPEPVLDSATKEER